MLQFSFNYFGTPKWMQKKEWEKQSVLGMLQNDEKYIFQTKKIGENLNEVLRKP